MGRRIDPGSDEHAARRPPTAAASGHEQLAPSRDDRPLADERAHVDAALDEALEETFPASDPIAVHHSNPR